MKCSITFLFDTVKSLCIITLFLVVASIIEVLGIRREKPGGKSKLLKVVPVTIWHLPRMLQTLDLVISGS